MAQPQRLQPALAIGLHVIGEDRVHQHRHMAADVVKDVRLLQVIELVAPPDEAGRREAARRQVGEEHIVGHEARHCDNSPAGGAIEDVAEPPEIRDAAVGLQPTGLSRGRDAEALQPVEIFAAGAACQQPLLAFEQEPPDGVLVLGIGRPVLLDRVIRPSLAHRALRNVRFVHPLHLGTPVPRVNRG